MSIIRLVPSTFIQKMLIPATSSSCTLCFVLTSQVRRAILWIFLMSDRWFKPIDFGLSVLLEISNALHDVNTYAGKGFVFTCTPDARIEILIEDGYLAWRGITLKHSWSSRVKLGSKVHPMCQISHRIINLHSVVLPLLRSKEDTEIAATVAACLTVRSPAW